MRVLADTSIWVDYLRNGERGAAFGMDRLLRDGELIVCGPVVAEVLKGARQTDRDTLWSFLRSLPWAALAQDEWHRVGELSAQLRETGMSVPLTDVAIAVSCAAAEAQLWTRDGDFVRLETVMPELLLCDPAT